jgi:histidinol-phosphate aminotransferase
VNRTGMVQIAEGLKRLKLEYIPSFGNFLSFRVAGAQPIYQRLLRQGVIVRPIAGYGMPEHLRVSIGLESENARFLAALESALHA